MDLISRNALLDAMPKNDELLSVDVRRIICEAHTVDAVEVVRCKDCKNYRYGVCKQIEYIMDGYYHDTFEVKRPDDFCSYGEKMDAKEE